MLSWAVDVFVSLGSHKIPPFDGSRNRRNKRECASYPRSHRKSNACLPILCCLPIPHCFSRQKKGQRGHANSLSSCPPWWSTSAAAAAAAAKSLQSCQTLCDPIDGSPPGSTIPGILQARTLEQVAISFSDAWKWKVKVKSLSYMKLLKVIINANTAYISTMYSVNRHFTHTVLNFPTITWGGFYTYHYEEGNWSCYVFRVMQQYKAKDPTQISMGCLFSIDSSHKEFSKKKKITLDGISVLNTKDTRIFHLVICIFIPREEHTWKQVWQVKKLGQHQHPSACSELSPFPGVLLFWLPLPPPS